SSPGGCAARWISRAGATLGPRCAVRERRAPASAARHGTKLVGLVFRFFVLAAQDLGLEQRDALVERRQRLADRVGQLAVLEHLPIVVLDALALDGHDAAGNTDDSRVRRDGLDDHRSGADLDA